MTPELEQFLRKGQSTFNAPKTLYRVYTEDVPGVDLTPIVKRYFDGATILRGVGLDARTQVKDEPAIVIEVITSHADGLQRVVNLAGDIRQLNSQISVLVTRQAVTTFEVTSPDTPTAKVDALDRSQCVECGNVIPDTVDSLVNPYHRWSCSLHSDNVVAAK
jgi:hypothetical protein